MPTSPRLNGPSEHLGVIKQLPEFKAEYGPDFERHLLRVVNAAQLGALTLSQAEVRIPATGVVRGSFVDREDFARGREDGVHGTRFGQMILNGADLHESPALVAIKPFGDDIESKPSDLLAQEWSMNNYLNSLSDEQIAYLPIGVWKNIYGINHLITLYEHDVVSLDNVFWADHDVNPEALRKETLEDAFRTGLVGLGYLHGTGVYHGDAEAKNLARDRRGVRFIDLETAAFLPPSKTAATQRTRQDLETFIDSTLQVDENREYVEKILDKRSTGKEFARLYRLGIRAAEIDTGKKFTKLVTSTDAYFNTRIDHARAVAHNHYKPKLA